MSVMDISYLNLYRRDEGEGQTEGKCRTAAYRRVNAHSPVT